MKRDPVHDLEHFAPVFAALGDETRLTLLRRLAKEGRLPVVRLLEGTGLTRQALTKHLRLLENVGLITGERAGRDLVFGPAPFQLKRASALLRHLARWSAFRVTART